MNKLYFLLPERRKILPLAAFLLLLVLLALVLSNKRNMAGLVSPGLKEPAEKTTGKPAVIPASQTPSYNPPEEIKYSSSTDLKQELESINPQVLDSDFN